MGSPARSATAISAAIRSGGKRSGSRRWRRTGRASCASRAPRRRRRSRRRTPRKCGRRCSTSTSARRTDALGGGGAVGREKERPGKAGVFRAPASPRPRSAARGAPGDAGRRRRRRRAVAVARRHANTTHQQKRRRGGVANRRCQTLGADRRARASAPSCCSVASMAWCARVGGGAPRARARRVSVLLAGSTKGLGALVSLFHSLFASAFGVAGAASTFLLKCVVFLDRRCVPRARLAS